jgi:hypothetical protein
MLRRRAKHHGPRRWAPKRRRRPVRRVRRACLPLVSSAGSRWPQSFSASRHVPTFIRGAARSADLPSAHRSAHSMRPEKLRAGRSRSGDFVSKAPILHRRLGTFSPGPSMCSARSSRGWLTKTKTARLASRARTTTMSKRIATGDWHRDSQFGQIDPELERRRILTTTSGHVRVALEDDDRLEIVPGSHRRWAAPSELQIRKGSKRAHSAMAAATHIAMKAGDACVFRAWSIHRTTCRRGPLRRTLTLSTRLAVCRSRIGRCRTGELGPAPSAVRRGPLKARRIDTGASIEGRRRTSRTRRRSAFTARVHSCAEAPADERSAGATGSVK